MKCRGRLKHVSELHDKYVDFKGIRRSVFVTLDDLFYIILNPNPFMTSMSQHRTLNFQVIESCQETTFS